MAATEMAKLHKQPFIDARTISGSSCPNVSSCNSLQLSLCTRRLATGNQSRGECGQGKQGSVMQCWNEQMQGAANKASSNAHCSSGAVAKAQPAIFRWAFPVRLFMVTKQIVLEISKRVLSNHHAISPLLPPSVMPSQLNLVLVP